MRNLSHIRSAIYGEPWLITETGLNQVCAIVENAISGGQIDEKFAALEAKSSQPVRNKYRVEDGVAIIPVNGTLFQHASLLSKMSGATGYDEITAMLNDAMERTDLSAVVLHINSPGGSVVGCFECASEIYAASQAGDIPVIAAIEGHGCSAAYMLASQCQHVCCSVASDVGSIGVVCRFNDLTRAEKNEGNDSVVMRSKELKAPGAGPMTPNQMMSVQKTMMKLDGMFESYVKRARPNVKKEAFTGESFIGDESKTLGLVDDILSLSDVVEQYGANLVR